MSEGKTFEEIVERVRRECNSYPLPNAAGEKLKLVREIEEAHNREILAERNLSNGHIVYLQDKLEAKDAEIERLRSLVKDLADDLSGYLCYCECNEACESFGNCSNQISRKIVAKAREVLK